MKAFLVPIKSLFVVATLVVAGLASRTAVAADSAAAGRKHAAKANQMAAKNKCKSAVVEFTKAYKTLKDPTILFNRAECQRKLGNKVDALKDYELFLAEMPAAPNRAGVEARMAALREAVKAESAAVPVIPKEPVATTSAGASPPTPPAPPATQEAKQAHKVPEAPVHRAEKWTD
ncbi:MAG TPA: hypothetical protein VF524_13860 [Polyangia bacterium]